MDKIKIIFIGTSEIGTGLLRALNADERFDVALVITQQNKPAGRKMELTSSPIKKITEKLSLSTFQPESINSPESIEKIKTIDPDIIIVFAYGQILSKQILDIPKHGCINVHASLLPKHRGASPIQSAILNRDNETGISLMQMVEKMDAGPVYEQFPIPIEIDDNSITLTEKTAHLISHKIPNLLYDIIENNLSPVPQNESQATYCTKINKENGNINWNEDIKIIDSRIRAFMGWPSSYTYFNGKRLKILEAKYKKTSHNMNPGSVIKEGDIVAITAKNGILIPVQLQIEGKNTQSIEDFINGNPGFINSILTVSP
ncbi:methionyl-tRNA formyltransferase [Patescibacteria group bacterium]|nr:methionyl-tRNA formyltransferase [Patescibacteria group bacterium]